MSGLFPFFLSFLFFFLCYLVLKCPQFLLHPVQGRCKHLNYPPASPEALLQPSEPDWKKAPGCQRRTVALSSALLCAAEGLQLLNYALKGRPAIIGLTL